MRETKNRDYLAHYHMLPNDISSTLTAPCSSLYAVHGTSTTAGNKRMLQAAQLRRAYRSRCFPQQQRHALRPFQYTTEADDGPSMPFECVSQPASDNDRMQILTKTRSARNIKTGQRR